MPYAHISERPHNVESVLPKHAQEIYLAVFNNAWDEYKNPEKRKTSESREEIAHKVAWQP
jgi:cation transport regulator